MNPTLETQTKAQVIRAEGSLTVANVDAFRTSLEEAIAASLEPKELIFDMSGIDLLDSSGLGGILALLKEAKDRGGNLRIAAPSRKVELVFDLTKARQVLEVHDTLEDALNAID